MPLDSKYLDVFLKSIKNTKDFGINIVEVLAYEYDDSQKVFDYRLINFKGTEIKIYRGPNIGFGKANNYLSKFAQGSHLFFLNPDARIKHLNLHELNILAERFSIIGIRQEIIPEEKFFSNSPNEFESEISFSGLSADIFFIASFE
jgi:GT2 family glycosyltransferase